MTCRDTLSLLDDFIDDELSPQQAAQVRDHLAACEECRAEYGAMARVKSLLGQSSVPEPPEEYWSEVSAIIQARTVDSVPLIRERVAEEKSGSAQMLMRSAVVFAASAVLLVTTLLISHKRGDQSQSANRQAPVYMSSHLTEQMNHPLSDYLSKQDQDRIAGGTLVIGAPSMVGRYSSLAGISLTY
ncbi:hypothetical protein C3F09_09415 [candidate division GN15 bacterium]|uniref:Putative zinc-finger domain-containing protein n=1 Tax=candidate division GN15 bacterium TaxID=2072418 RepID=A0A855WXV7_9BACT|nr:MAG: hypothetical protein C3F09_09415 [candidate division GN15 bacterium]